MSLCLTLGALTVALPVSAFTLAWTHSVEKIRWEEDWRISAGRLVLEEARVKGSGAGMDPPPDAARVGGFWRWTPDLPPIEALNLARSRETDPYEICAGGGCLSLDDYLGSGATGVPARLESCARRAALSLR